MLSLTLNANGGFSIFDYKPMCIQVRLIEQYLFYLNFKGLVFVFAVYPVAEQLNR